MTNFNPDANKGYEKENAKISDIEIDVVDTTIATGYQLEVTWRYRCKKHQRWKYALGISFKVKEGELTKADLLAMRNDADENATWQFQCTPIAMYRWKIILKHYVPVKQGDLDKRIRTFRIKKENILEYDRINNILDFNLSYKDAKEKFEKAKEEKEISGNFYGKNEYYTLRKILNKEEMTAEEKKKARRIRYRNKNIIDLYSKVREYKKK